MRTTTKILIAIGIFLAAFIIAMIVVFCVKGFIPDVLIECTLGASGFEALLCALVRSAKVIKGAEGENAFDGKDDII